jgi:hypothetical protein
MGDECRGNIEIYQYFSDCLKNFRARMALLCKLSHPDL